MISTLGCRVARLRRLAWQAACWLMLLLMAQTVQADRDKRLEHMLSLSGIADVMSSYPEQLHQQLYRSGAIIGAADVAQVEARLVNAYEALDIDAALHRYVAARIRPAQLDAILAWYDSPLGSRLLAAERQAETAAGHEDMQRFLVEFDRHPPADERIRLIRRFEQVARLSYINLGLIRALFETEFIAANAQRPQQAGLDARQFQAAMEQQFADQTRVLQQHKMISLGRLAASVCSPR